MLSPVASIHKLLCDSVKLDYFDVYFSSKYLELSVSTSLIYTTQRLDVNYGISRSLENASHLGKIIIFSNLNFHSCVINYLSPRVFEMYSYICAECSRFCNTFINKMVSYFQLKVYVLDVFQFAIEIHQNCLIFMVQWLMSIW